MFPDYVDMRASASFHFVHVWSSFVLPGMYSTIHPWFFFSSFGRPNWWVIFCAYSGQFNNSLLFVRTLLFQSQLEFPWLVQVGVKPDRSMPFFCWVRCSNNVHLWLLGLGPTCNVLLFIIIIIIFIVVVACFHMYVLCKNYSSTCSHKKFSRLSQHWSVNQMVLIFMNNSAIVTVIINIMKHTTSMRFN